MLYVENFCLAPWNWEVDLIKHVQKPPCFSSFTQINPIFKFKKYGKVISCQSFALFQYQVMHSIIILSFFAKIIHVGVTVFFENFRQRDGRHFNYIFLLNKIHIWDSWTGLCMGYGTHVTIYVCWSLVAEFWKYTCTLIIKSYNIFL